MICDPLLTIRGQRRSANLGRSATRMGDLNNDGCEEIALSAHLRGNGVARVLFGWGGDGCPAQPRVVGLGTGVASANFSHALAAANLLGSPTPDLVVGSPRGRTPQNQRRGTVQIVDGDWIVGLPRQAPDAEELTIHVVDEAPGTIASYGQTNEERFGDAVTVVDGVVVVGHPVRRHSPELITGGAELFRVSAEGFERVGVVTGETWHQGDYLGSMLSSEPGGNLLVIGGHRGSGITPKGGSAYVFSIDELP